MRDMKRPTKKRRRVIKENQAPKVYSAKRKTLLLTEHPSDMLDPNGDIKIVAGSSVPDSVPPEYAPPSALITITKLKPFPLHEPPIHCYLF